MLIRTNTFKATQVVYKQTVSVESNVISGVASPGYVNRGAGDLEREFDYSRLRIFCDSEYADKR